MISLFYYPSDIENQVRIRIRLLLAAYQYEFEPEGKMVMNDCQFDENCSKVDLTIKTGSEDQWWFDNFNPHTGQWINKHPRIERIKEIYRRNFK